MSFCRYALPASRQMKELMDDVRDNVPGSISSPGEGLSFSLGEGVAWKKESDIIDGEFKVYGRYKLIGDEGFSSDLRLLDESSYDFIEPNVGPDVAVGWNF